MKTRISCLLLLLLALAACQSQSEEPRIAANWQPTAVSAHPQRATATPLPTATEPVIPTREPTATAVANPPIPTIQPTEIPPGVYIRQSDGFTFHYPSAWEFEETDEGGIQLSDPDLGVVVIVNSDFQSEDDYESLKEYFTTQWGDAVGATNVTILDEKTISLGEDNTAQIAILSATPEGGQPVGIYVAYAEDEVRSFSLIAFGQLHNLEARQRSLDEMVHQAQMGGTQLFGLDPDNTLVLLGYEPLPRSLDPARQLGSADSYVGLLYSGLVRLTPDLQVVPDLAETWEVSPDGTVYTFTLREGLTFADGRPLTAADVQYSWERAANPDTESTTAATYLGDIAGVTEKLDGEADSISGVTVIDDRTLEVTLTGPKPYFLLKLTYPTSFVVDQESVESADPDEWVFTPNPSGPYALAERIEDERWTFTRNEAFYNQPAIENVVYLISRAGNPLSLFEAGEIDLTYLGTTDAQEVRRPTHPLHDQWISTTSLCTTFVQMNNTLPPFDDPLVRQAFALAVDKEGQNELLTEGMDVIADTILPPGMPGYTAALAETQSANRFNTEAAQAALAASTYADDLPPVIINASGYGDSDQDYLNAMISTWQDVLGVEVTIELLDPENFSATVREEHGHMVAYGWCADYPDPENFLDVLYHSESDFNVSGYSNPEVDALLEEARVELDVNRRLELYEQIESLLLADYATVPLRHGVSDVLVSDRIEGFVLVPIGAPIIPLLSLNPEGEGE